MELLERVTEVGGQLLRVERYPDRAPDRRNLAPALLLTFDVGVVLVWVNAGEGRLETDHIRDIEDAPRNLTRLDEQEPWWRVIGSPLTAVDAVGGKRCGFRLRFRPEDRNPRFVRLMPEDGSVRVRMEKPAKSD
jgi:hypothetical protein